MTMLLIFLLAMIFAMSQNARHDARGKELDKEAKAQGFYNHPVIAADRAASGCTSAIIWIVLAIVGIGVLLGLAVDGMPQGGW